MKLDRSMPAAIAGMAANVRHVSDNPALPGTPIFTTHRQRLKEAGHKLPREYPL